MDGMNLVEGLKEFALTHAKHYNPHKGNLVEVFLYPDGSGQLSYENRKGSMHQPIWEEQVIDFDNDRQLSKFLGVKVTTKEYRDILKNYNDKHSFSYSLEINEQSSGILFSTIPHYYSFTFANGVELRKLLAE